MSCLPCTSEEAEFRRAQKIRSRSIDEELLRDRDEYRATHRLLLLGPSGSGKSTIMKQLKISHVDWFSEIEEQMIVSEIKSNIKEIITTVIKAMPILNPPIALQLPENEQHVKYILEEATKPDYDFPEEFYEVCMKLWEDKGVMECYGRSNEYHLLDCAPYFMDPEKIETIAKPNFSPSSDDILHCKITKNGIFETKFVVEKLKFHLVDVGGQQSELRKWIQGFNDVTAILFIVDCSSYNLYLREDPSKNKLEEALELFESVWNNRWLKNVSVIMFLNKQDLLKAKVLEGRFKIETYFPEYSSYQIPTDSYCEPGENEEVRRAKRFIRDLFVQITKASPDSRHALYSHFTCINDTENIHRVFNDCRDIIQRIHLRQYELMEKNLTSQENKQNILIS